MFESARQDDLPKILARSFIRAWERYYLSAQSEKISEEIARPSLAKHLVAMANEGVKEEDALAAGGLLHLISITPDKPLWEEFRIEVVPAKFLHQWNVRVPPSVRVRTSSKHTSAKRNRSGAGRLKA
jgi:hypothetical protein